MPADWILDIKIYVTSVPFCNYFSVLIFDLNVYLCFLCIGKCFDMNIRFVLFYFRCDLNSVTSEVI